MSGPLASASNSTEFSLQGNAALSQQSRLVPEPGGFFLRAANPEITAKRPTPESRENPARRLTEVKDPSVKVWVMTPRTLLPDRRPTNPTGTWVALGSILLLTGLALADRLVAWLIGEFPASAALWQLRFEYLRPVGVFHDIAVTNLGDISMAWFGLAVVLCGLVVALGAVSRIRVVRALSYHLLLGIALALTVFSLGPSAGIFTKVGAPSALYVMIGLLLSVSAAILCILTHAEYVGWTPRNSLLRRRITARVARRLSGLWQKTLPAAGVFQPALARVRSERRGAASH